MLALIHLASGFDVVSRANSRSLPRGTDLATRLRLVEVEKLLMCLPGRPKASFQPQIPRVTYGKVQPCPPAGL